MLEVAQRKMDIVKGEQVDMVVRFGLNLEATQIFGTIKYWLEMSMLSIYNAKLREEDQLARGLREEGKATLNWYVDNEYWIIVDLIICKSRPNV